MTFLNSFPSVSHNTFCLGLIQLPPIRRNRRLPMLAAIMTFAVTLPWMTPPSSQAACFQDEAAAQNIALTASNAQNSGEYVFAAQQWEKLLNEHANSALAGKAHYNAGICFLQSNEFDKAIGHFKSSLPKLENDEAVQKPQASLYLGFAQFRSGQRLKQLAKTAEANQMLTTATQTFAQLLQNHSDFADADQACFFQGGAFEALGQKENALSAYTKMLDFPKQTFKLEGLYAIADMHDQLGQYAEALKFFEQAHGIAKTENNPLVNEIQWRTGSTWLSLASADDNRGDKEASTEKLNRAQSLLSDLVAQHGDSTDPELARIVEDARFELAVCSKRLGQFETAAKLFETVAANSESPLASQSLANAARSYIDADQPDSAKPILERILAGDSKNRTLAAHWLAGIYLKSEDFEKAYSVATQQIDNAEESDFQENAWVPLLMDQADAAFEIPTRRNASIALFDAIVESHPDHELAPSALHSSAFTSLDTNDFKTAIETAQRFESKYPQSEYLADTLEVQAESYLLDNQPAEAAKIFERLVATFTDHPKRFRWQIRSGLASYMNKQYDAAVQKLAPLVAPGSETIDDPARAEALFWMGSSQFELQDYANAAKSLADSYAKNSRWKRTEETLLTLCRAQLATDKTTDAAATGKLLSDGFPDSPLLADLHYHLGEHDYESKNFENAFEHFDTINRNYRDSKFAPYALYNAAYSQLELRNYPESDKLFTQLISQFPTHELSQRAKIGRGASRRKTGDVEASIADLQEFLKTGPQGDSRTNALYELGLAQIDVKQWDAAIETFQTLISESTDSPRLDRYCYELAWAYRSSDKEDLAMKFFTQITTDYPQSPLAAEANFHVGTAAYNNENFPTAIAAYQKCLATESEDHIREKAAYKLGWAHYKQDQFAEAHQAFSDQVEKFPTGDLFADGMFMVAESQYRQKNHQQAYEAYTAAKPVVDSAAQIDPKIKWLTLLHGAQSANKLKKYDEALGLVKDLVSSEADVSFKQDAWLEMGTAYSGLKQPGEALKYYQLASKNLGKTGARAHCMIGDLYFADKKFVDAVNEFKLVYFGFGGPLAADDVKPWQAYAIYEAARCNFVQVNSASDELKPKLVDEAIKQFEYLLKHYGDDRLAEEARKQLETLKKIGAG